MLMRDVRNRSINQIRIRQILIILKSIIIGGIENGSPDVFPAGEEQQLVVSRPASSIREQSLEYDPAGNLYLKQGAPRLGNLADFRKEKENQNNTGTADIYRYLYHVEDESVDGIHKFRIYQGNNGRLSAPLPKGTLSVKKEVENGKDAEISDFKFKIELPQDSQDVEHLKNQDGSGIDWDGNVGTFSLKKDETKVLSLKHETKWKITETTDYEGEWKDHWTNTVTAEPENGVTFDNLSAKGSMTAGGRTDVVFKSVHDTHTGTLTVSREVDGDISASGTSQFTFTLITVSEDKTEKSETFTLGDSQSRSFKIEEGTRWTVEESDPGENWKTEIIGDTGVVTDPGNRICTSGTMGDGGQQVAFKNTYTAPGSLVVSKRVEGDPGTQQYEFKVTIGSEKKKLFLKNGESHVYENLSEGTEWSVEEVSKDPGENWTTTVNGEKGKKIEGTIASGEISSASFVNRAPGTLIVKKTVSQGNGDANKQFDFKLKYKNTEQHFSLRNGETERFELPAGTEYSVEEMPAEGWHVSIGGEEEKNSFSGRILAGSEMTVEFVNSCEKSGTGPSQGGTAVKNTVLHYESNGGTKYEDESYRLNTSVTLDKVPVREGYTFTGWFEDEKLTRPVTEIRMTSDKTVYAGWKITGIPDRLDGRDHFAYIIGYTDGNVHPTANISRAEVATILFRLLDPEVRKQNLTTENIFDDVKPGMWYNTAVSTLSRMGIVKGRTGGLFDPDASITRAEFAAVCARFDDSGAEADSNFTDISGHWAEKEIARASVLGWIRGYSDGTFRPDNRITRAEAVTMINRVLQRLPESESDLLPDMNVWPDNRQTDWYYLPVQEATNSHDFERKKDGVHEHWTGMTEDPDWKQYEITGNIS